MDKEGGGGDGMDKEGGVGEGMDKKTKWLDGCE